MRVVANAPQHTEGWYAARLGIPTASRFAHVLAQGKGNAPSLTRQKYVVELALERITGRREELKPTEAMDVGTEREPLARQAYMVRTGELVSEAGLCLHDTLDCGASPDGVEVSTAARPSGLSAPAVRQVPIQVRTANSRATVDHWAPVVRLHVVQPGFSGGCANRATPRACRSGLSRATRIGDQAVSGRRGRRAAIH